MKHQRPTQSTAGKLGGGEAEISLFTKIPGGAERRETEKPQPALLKTDQPKVERPKADPPKADPRETGAPMAAPARAKPRHRRLALSFVLLVLLPTAVAAYYLYFVANDQYASRTGFSVRKEEMDTAVEILGGITNFSGSSSTDTDVLYEFIHSQELVERLDERLDLRAIYSKPEWDPVFAFDTDGTVEDLIDYWRWMVPVYYDAGTGLIEVRVNAFEPDDAQRIAQAVVDESSSLINELSAIAREDATRYTREELEDALERLKQAREAMTEFRVRTQMVDPEAELEGQMQVVNSLQAKLSEARVERELLESEQLNSTKDDIRQEVRLSEAQRRIDAIKRRLEEERQRFGIGAGDPGDGQAGYASVVAEFERLALDQEFAEQTYLAAFSSYNGALAEAQRQSRYLAPYLKPTKAQRAEYPRRATLLGLTALFLMLGWSILALIYYSLRERR